MPTDTVSTRIRESGLLYPMLLIVAIALTVFSAVSVATVMGWMPGVMAGVQPSIAHGAGGDSRSEGTPSSTVLVTDRSIVAGD
jgi:hypothetical protein